jgi:hypothetical protein
MHAKWIWLVLTQPTAVWTILPQEFLTFFPLKDHIYTSHPLAASLITSTRWQQFLAAWLNIISVHCPPLDHQYLSNEALWYNRFKVDAKNKPFGTLKIPL